MAGSDDLRFQMMGMGGPMAGAPTAPPPAAGKKDAKEPKADAGYPTFESLLSDKAKFESLVASAAKSMGKLEEIADKGANPQVKAEARKAIRAYDHAMDLLKRGLELTSQIMKERQAKAGKAPGKK